MFQLARGYRERGMAAYTGLQQAELSSERHGYSATRHQREVGTGYFDLVATAVSGGTSSTLALEGSTEASQFTAGARNGHTHANGQIQAALEEDHGRLETLLSRLRDAKDVPALTSALEALNQLLTEHFAHEEHAKGFYGVLGAGAPHYRSELERMIAEHGELLGLCRQAQERAKGHGGVSDVGELTSRLAARLAEHEARESKLVQALA
jgi:hypothetical protein